MNNICCFEFCTGCSACYNICPHHAVTMEELEEGFLYPSIDKKLCVNCKLCETICPANNHLNFSSEPKKTYAAWSKDKHIRQQSSSGGIFSVLANHILNKKGVVYGAAYNKYMQVEHIEISKKEDLNKLQGSKYVQSNINLIYRKTKEKLKNGQLVYFTGTPCQIAGLKAFLKKEYSNLYTSDLICHGVPSNKLFLEQIQNIEHKIQEKIVDFKFRSKQRYGQGCDIEITDKDKNKYYYMSESIPYFWGFWKNITLRESCYHCKFATLNRPSDITLADYWNIKKIHKNVRTSKGISLVLINTDKGLNLFSNIEKNIYSINDEIDNALKIQSHLKHPVSKKKMRLLYEKEKEKENFLLLVNKYLTPNKATMIKFQIRNFIKTIVLYKYWK